MELDHDPAPEVLADKTVEVSPAIVPPGQKLDEADRLAIENIYLRMQNCQLQVQNCDNTKSLLLTEMHQLQNDMEKKKAALGQKYGIPIDRTSVKPDGTIVQSNGKA